MNIASIINELLFEFDCVIVPNFGGFVANTISAKIDKETGFFCAPSKQISFNSFLKHNDGLLANRIAKIQNISFEQANKIIAENVATWNQDLHIKSIDIDALGKLFLNQERLLCFEPNLKHNYLTSSFGFSSLNVKPIQREVSVTKVLPIYKEEKVSEYSLIKETKDELEQNEKHQVKKQNIPVFVKYAASVAILMTFTYIGFNIHSMNRQKNLLLSRQQEVEQKIQRATFVINSPLPTVSLNIARKVQEVSQDKPYHIIAGAFSKQANALKKVSQLKDRGYHSRIVGKNKWGLSQVAYNSYETIIEAKEALQTIKVTENSQAWILVK